MHMKRYSALLYIYKFLGEGRDSYIIIDQSPVTVATLKNDPKLEIATLFLENILPNVPITMPGYQRNVLELESVLKYLCILCQLVLREPIQSICGHRFCNTCVQEFIHQSTGRNKCPKCIEEDPDSEDSVICPEEVNPDYAIRREMKRLPSKCVNHGCSWKGSFSEYMEHEKDCKYLKVMCQNQGCSVKIRKSDLKKHQLEECEMRLIYCELCGIQKHFKDLQIHQLTECPKTPISCKFCSKKILREKLQQHTDIRSGDCKRKRQYCKFHDIGCDELIENGKQPQHDLKASQDHMNLLLYKVSDYNHLSVDIEAKKKDFLQISTFIEQHEGKISALRDHTTRLEGDLKETVSKLKRSPIEYKGGEIYHLIEESEASIKALKNTIAVLERKVTTYEGIVAVLNSEVERSAEIVQSLKREEKRTRELLEAIERKVKAQDRIIALKDVVLAEQDLRIQSLEMVSYDGILTWRITGFARKRRDAISGRTLSIYSPYFFTSRFGYKMCARIYLNGDGMGKGNHASLFFVIMKGEYDAILKWPFSQKVTFMWIDQNNRDHSIDAFRPDPNSSSFKRPTGDLNIASGCPLFMPLSKIDTGSEAFVKDDTAYLRIIVDTSDL
ncbi:TNF receptor-associated factor 2-like [Glandiceps talaboti]